MFKKIAVPAIIALATPTLGHAASYSADAGYTVTSVYSDAVNSFAGLTVGGGTVTFGVPGESTIDRISTAGGTPTAIASFSGTGTDIPFITPVGSTLYTAYSTSYSLTAPYTLGPIVGNAVQPQLQMPAIYDAASAGGLLYFVAASGSDSSIYADVGGAAKAIANIGGYSGGMAFDGSGDLYYGATDHVLEFTATKIAGALASGGTELTALDGRAVNDVASASRLAFDTAGHLLLTSGYGASLGEYDATTGSEIAELATTQGESYFGNIAYDDGSVYAAVTDYGGEPNEIIAITAVPEPTMACAALGSVLLVRRRR